MDTASILVVCTGNIRRSPAMAALLRHGTSSADGLEGSGVTVSSAGLRAVVGDPVDPLVEQQLRAHDAPVGHHAARQLTPELIREADLVITAEREHRAAVVRMAPEAVRYAFTLRELAALGGSVGRGALGGPGTDVADRLRELVQRGPLERATRTVRRAEDDDLPDLRRRSRREARRLVNDVQVAVDALLHLLAPEPPLSITVRPATSEDEPDAGPPARLSAG
jgi:protein-tyrosine phosphatase